MTVDLEPLLALLRPMSFEDEQLVRRAAAIMESAHAGVTDKLGDPYVEHPLAVATMVARAGYGASFVAVALLHDTIEDTTKHERPVTAQVLQDEGMPEEVVAGTVAMTKIKGEPLATSIARACADPCARVVKPADVAHNTLPERVARLSGLVSESDQKRLAVKYEETRALLDAGGAAHISPA